MQKFSLEKVKKEEENILQNLLEFYLYDFNFFYEDDLNDNGRFEFIDTNEYFTKEKYEAFFIRVKDKLAGFILINNNTELIKNGTRIEEFWIMPKYRKGYFAFSVLKEVFSRYQNEIEFIILEQNKRWLKAINYFINKNYTILEKEEITKWDTEKFKLYLIKNNKI